MEEEEVVINRPSRAERLVRSTCARMKRKLTKSVRAVHEYKEEREARSRLKAQRKRKKVEDALDISNIL